MEVINKLGYCCFGKIGIAYLRKYYIPSGMRKECILFCTAMDKFLYVLY